VINILRAIKKIVKCSYDSINNTSFHNGNYAVSLFKQDYFPVFALTTLQNEEAHGKHYFFRTSFEMGRNVDGSKTPGDFVQDSDAQLFIESRKGTLMLDKGFELKTGAELEFKNQE
jgi:hypothetical protein